MVSCTNCTTIKLKLKEQNVKYNACQQRKQNKIEREKLKVVMMREKHEEMNEGDQTPAIMQRWTVPDGWSDRD